MENREQQAHTEHMNVESPEQFIGMFGIREENIPLFREELGVEVSISGPAAVTLAFEGGYDDYFLAEWNGSLTELTLQKEEVMDAKWASREEMLAMLLEGTFAPFWPSFIQLLFDLHQHMGLSN